MCECPLRGLQLCTSEVFWDFWPPTLARKSNRPPLVIFCTITAFRFWTNHLPRSADVFKETPLLHSHPLVSAMEVSSSLL